MKALGEAAPTAGLPPLWRDALASGAGPSFESALCATLGLADIEITGTGTAALFVAFTWLKGQSPGRTRVIVPGYTCPLVVIAAQVAGLECIACDLVPGGFDLDLGHLQRLLDQRTLAVVATHYGGALTDVGRVAAALPPGVAIVEDAAQAVGATWSGQSVGLAGDIGVFSFGAGKGLTIFEGGGLVARDPHVMAGIRETARRHAAPAFLAEVRSSLALLGYHAVYNPLGLRFAYGARKRYWLARGDEIEAAGDRFDVGVPVHRVGAWRKRVGRAALVRLPGHLAACRRRFETLADRLAAVPGVRVHHPQPQAAPSATFLFVTLPETDSFQALQLRLWRSRLGVAKLFSRAIGDYPEMQPLLQRSETPHARALAATTLTITTESGLSEAHEAAIVAALAEGRDARRVGDDPC